MRRKVLCAAGAMCAFVSAAVFAVVEPAPAQPYQPGLCRPLFSSSFAGDVNVGGTIPVPLTPICIWDTGSDVVVTVNGEPVGTKTADSSGFVTVSITATSPSELSVDDPVIVNGRCGENRVRGVGPSAAAQADVTHVATFNVLCPGAVAKPSKARVALTGANVMRWSAIAFGLVVVGGLFLAIDRRRTRPGE